MGIKLKSVGLDTSGGLNGAGATTISGTVTVASNSQRILIVGYLGRSRTVNSMTYGGVSMTRYQSSAIFDQCLTEWWYIVNPAVGSATLTANLSANSDSRDFLAYASFYNVDTVNPFVTFVTSTGTAASVSVYLNGTYDNTYMIGGNFNTGNLSGDAISPAVLFAERDQSDSGGASYLQITTAANTNTGFNNFSSGSAYSYLYLELKPAELDGGGFLYNLI
jgi:hypothetical protein